MALDLWHIIPACIGFGMGGELIRRYRAFKHRRRQQPYAVRNAGFWTDRRLIRAEAIVCALVACGPWTIIILAVAIDRPIWIGALATLSYAGFIWLLMAGLNAHSDKDGNITVEE